MGFPPENPRVKCPFLPFLILKPWHNLNFVFQRLSPKCKWKVWRPKYVEQLWKELLESYQSRRRCNVDRKLGKISSSSLSFNKGSYKIVSLIKEQSWQGERLTVSLLKRRSDPLPKRRHPRKDRGGGNEPAASKPTLDNFSQERKTVKIILWLPFPLTPEPHQPDHKGLQEEKVQDLSSPPLNIWWQ